MILPPETDDPDLLHLWELVREQRPVLVLRCGACRGREGKLLGQVWATQAGLLLHYFCHRAAQRVTVDVDPAIGRDQLVEHLSRSNLRYDPSIGTAFLRDWRDPAGRLLMLDRPTGWLGAAAACVDDPGVVELDREDLLSLAFDAVRRGSRATVRLSARQ